MSWISVVVPMPRPVRSLPAPGTVRARTAGPLLDHGCVHRFGRYRRRCPCGAGRRPVRTLAHRLGTQAAAEFARSDVELEVHRVLGGAPPPAPGEDLVIVDGAQGFDGLDLGSGEAGIGAAA